MNLFRIASILSFERNILSFIIIAGRYEDAIRKYGEENKHVIDRLKELDKSGNLKFLDWQMKQYKNDNSIEIEELAGLSSIFDRYKSSFKKKDINQYTFDELRNEVNSYVKSARDKAIETADFSDIEKYSEALTKFSIPRGSVKLNDNYGPGWEVWAIRSKAGSVEAGKNTAWCISMPNSSYYEKYEDDGAVHFFCINKNEKPVVYHEKAIRHDKIDLSHISLSLYVNDNDEQNRKIDKIVITAGNNQVVEKSFISENSTLDIDKAIKDATQFVKTAKLVKSKDTSNAHIKDMIAIGRNPGTLAKYINDNYYKFNENEKLFAAMINFDVFFDNARYTKHKPDISIIEKAAKSKNNVNSKYLKLFAKYKPADWYRNEQNLPDGSYINNTFDVGHIKNGKLHRDDGPAIERFNGDKEWYINGKLHKENGPAIELDDGTKSWYKNGKRHREDGPANEFANGDKEWRINDELHRDGGPAVEKANGDKEWYKNGKLHREDGPAIEKANGDKEWLINGKRHRDDGPAVENDGRKEWWVNGKLHRDDGPAIEYTSGDKEWYMDGEIHREGGPAIERVNGDKEWRINGKFHRKGGPAREYANGRKEWWVNGRLHREDGPAIEYDDDELWFLDGTLYSEEEYNVEMERRKKSR